MPAGQVQPALEQTVQDPLMELYQLAVQALQTQDCQAAMGVCQGFIMIVQQEQNGAGEVCAPKWNVKVVVRSNTTDKMEDWICSSLPFLIYSYNNYVTSNKKIW